MSFDNIVEPEKAVTVERPKLDYSKFIFTDNSIVQGLCTGVSECQVKTWSRASGKPMIAKDPEGNPIMAPGVRFAIDAFDANGEPAPLAYDVAFKVAYRPKDGSETKMSGLGKTLQAIKTPAYEVVFDRGLLVAYLKDLETELKNNPQECMLRIKINTLKANPPKYPKESRFIRVTEVLPPLAKPKMPKPREQPVPPSKPVGYDDADKVTIDTDDLPF